MEDFKNNVFGCFITFTIESFLQQKEDNFLVN